MTTRITTFIKDATTSKYAKLSTPQLRATLNQTRKFAAAAKDRWYDLSEEDWDNGIRGSSSATRSAEITYLAYQRRVSKLDKLLRARGESTTEPQDAPKDSFHRESTEHSGSRPGSIPKAAPPPPSPRAVPQPASRLQALQGLLRENDADARAFKICQLPTSYLTSSQCNRDVRLLVPTLSAYKQAALKLHPDKVVPHARVASSRERTDLSNKTNALWQAIAAARSEIV